MIGTSMPHTMEQSVLINPDAVGGLVILCDHATNHVPEAYQALGLASHHFDEHIAFDIGAEAVTRKMCEMMNISAVLGPVSRLLIDCNRELDHPTLIPPSSDGIIIPANQDLTTDAVARRVDAFYTPFHNAAEATIDRHLDAGVSPLVVGMHSFTPNMGDEDRPWHIGFLWNDDPRLAQAMIGLLERETDLVIGDNLPYSGKDLYHTMQKHGADRGLAQTTIEIRQDLVDTDEKVLQWAALLADVLDECMNREDLKRLS